MAEALLADAGYTREDAPVALRTAVDGLTQAAVLRDAMFVRVVELGGPTSERGRRRSAVDLWVAASDRAERLLRLVGLERSTKRINVAERIAAFHGGDE
jgi:hypothetical protein